MYLFLPLKGFSQVVLEHSGYTSVFDTGLKYPVMVRWVDTKERVVCNQIPRKDCFSPDPILKEQTSIQIDYDIANRTQKSLNSKGFDRGHMCPAADNQCPMTVRGLKIEAKKLQEECFYFSNMVPQFHSLNAGVWKKLEERTRMLASTEDSVFVWCGSIGTQFKYGKMSVPSKCWKVIYVVSTKSWESYLFDNSLEKNPDLERCRVTKEEIEKLTGLKIYI
jgi:endonuclease G